MLTLMGDKMATRVGASLLLAAGLEELVTTTYEQYEELAVTLALDNRRLLSMRRHLELSRDTSAAFDTARWVRNMEQGLIQVWDRHAAGLSPDDLDVIDTRPLFYHRMWNTINTERKLRERRCCVISFLLKLQLLCCSLLSYSTSLSLLLMSISHGFTHLIRWNKIIWNETNQDKMKYGRLSAVYLISAYVRNLRVYFSNALFCSFLIEDKSRYRWMARESCLTALSVCQLPFPSSVLQYQALLWHGLLYLSVIILLNCYNASLSDQPSVRAHVR